MIRPLTIDVKALAAVDDEWRTARDLHKIIGEEASATARTALQRLADQGKIDRRYDPHRNGKIALYRRKVEALEDA